MAGVAPMASATIVEVGFTAYGWDSEPTYTHPMSSGFTSGTLAIMPLAASVAMVTTSSSGDGTDFWFMNSPLPIALPFTPHTLPISSGVMRYLGT